MTHHKLTALDRYENELMHRSSQALASGDVEDSCEKLRLMCLSRGAGGLVALGRGFRRMDNDGNKHVDLEDFTTALRDAGFHLTDIEAEEVFNYFDKEGSGSINMTEFLVGIRPEMSESRQKIVKQAFTKLDKSGDGVITQKVLKQAYSVRNNPLFQNGDESEAQIYGKFLSAFEEGGDVEGRITLEEFENYYSGMSASIDNDGYFDLMIRQCYKL